MGVRIIEPAGLGRGLSIPTGARIYTTSFPLTENPISEGGAWHASGLGLTRTDTSQAALSAASTPVVTASGVAHGTSAAAGSSGFDDSRALLSGFPANHSASAVIHSSGITGTFVEVELHLRFDDSGTFARGYECYISGFGQYCAITRWNGDGTFTVLCGLGTLPHTPANGDVFFAQIVGNVITVKLAGVTQIIYDVTTAAGTPMTFALTGAKNSDGDGSALVFSAGNPGMGFDADGDDSAFGFSSYTAVGL